MTKWKRIKWQITDLQNTTHTKSNDRATLKTEEELRCFGKDKQFLWHIVFCSSYNSCDAPWMTKEYILNVITMLSKICISNYEYLVLHNIYEEFEDTKGMNAKPSWALSYGRWIYNCICIQCISPLKLWVRISVMAKCTRYNSRWYSLSVTCHTSMFFTVYSDFLH